MSGSFPPPDLSKDTAELASDIEIVKVLVRYEDSKPLVPCEP